MIERERIEAFGLTYLTEYQFDKSHRSFVFAKDRTCFILDDNICQNEEPVVFDYSKYCEMQNSYAAKYDRLYRFNIVTEEDLAGVPEWMSKTPEQISIDDTGGSFDSAHPDNTPLEKTFEDLFVEAYGDNAAEYLKKEFPVSLNNGKNAFIDYVVETKTGNYAIEENGVHYHHPCLIGEKAYRRQLEKQNTLNLYNFKVFRFSSQNISFKEQTIDNIQLYLGSKENFINSTLLKEERKFRLYQHQEEILKDIREARAEGVSAALVVIPTGTGKSQIVLEDLEALLAQQELRRVLVMVPSLRIKEDWETRTEHLKKKLDVSVKVYNTVFLERNTLPKDYYDYIVFDEAHHAQAANCKKTIQYFTPKFLIGLTATPDRLDQRKLEEIFGQYETKLTLKEAIEKHVISNIRCYRLRSNIDLSEVRYNGKDYNYADLEKTLVIDSRNELIVKTVKKYFGPQDGFYKQGIVFCVNIQHCKKLEKMFSEAGIAAKAVYGSNRENDRIFEQYRKKEVQFLLSCQVISEGWDSPQTEIVVMARPTLSRVLYLQQIGRGVRNYPGKECLYVVDVVDNYAGKLTPWNFNSLFKIAQYRPFAGVIDGSSDYLNILGLSEEELAMEEIDVFTFEEKYHDYRSLEQAARELFVGTNTLNKWVKTNPKYASLYLPVGKKVMPYFSADDIDRVRVEKNLKAHSDETILQDFLDFIDENTLTFSFKLIFMINMLTLADSEGEVNIDALIDRYSEFYLERIRRNLPVDRKGCIFDEEYLMDRTKVKKSILENPFEKFERKRFVYFSKDLNILSFNPALWRGLDSKTRQEIVDKERGFLQVYYQKLGGLQTSSGFPEAAVSYNLVSESPGPAYSVAENRPEYRKEE